MRKSITTKLFLAVFLFFTFFVIATIIMQTLFFKKFYTQRKTNAAIEAVNSFASSYKRGHWSDYQLNKKMNTFITKNNAMMITADKLGNIENLNALRIEIKSDKNKIAIIPLKDISNSKKLEKISFFMGKTVSMKGTYTDKKQTCFNPYYISSDTLQWSMLLPPKSIDFNPANLVVTDQKLSTYITLGYKMKYKSYVDIPSSMYNMLINTKHLSGKMSYVNSINNESVNDEDLYKINIFIKFISKWFETDSRKINCKNNTFVKYMSGRINSNEDSNIIFISPVNIGKKCEYIFTMESLKPVNEVLDVMNQYYIYVLFIAFVLILALALFFAKMISKPLIKINDAAVKMANMDFSEHIKINSDDEIGTLSQSINTLSDKLQFNINNLKNANQKLKKDIERERKIEEMRKDFIASASHELKTPLSVIRSFSEGIADGISQEKQKHYIDVILNETEKMNSLVMDMLELSKLESGNYKLTKEDFDICSLIYNVMQKFVHTINDKNLNVVYNFCPESITVNADKCRIEEVLENLISNTIKYAWNDHKIYISVIKNDNNIEISIENEGDKIPEDKINKIWDRFYRVEESRNKKTGGTGLGLSIVKNILELHKSTYGAMNTSNGVKFYFTLD